MHKASTISGKYVMYGLTMWNKAEKRNRVYAVEYVYESSAVYHLLHVFHPCFPPKFHFFNPLHSVLFFKASTSSQTSRLENSAMLARMTSMEESVTNLQEQLVRSFLTKEVTKQLDSIKQQINKQTMGKT